METSDDEDVLLENSPLYDYLKEACPDENFLTCQTTSTHEQLEDSDVTSVKAEDGELESGWFTRLKDYRQQDSQIVAETYLPQYMSVILNSQSMFTEDIQILLMYSNEKVPDGSAHRELAYPDGPIGNGQTFPQVLSTFGLFATLVGLCVGGYRAASLESDITSFQIITWLVLLVLCLVNSTLYGSAWWVNNLLHRQHKDNMKLLDSLVTLHDKYGSLLRKCIRYVQEIEVISRGFTLATPFTPAAQLDGLDNLLAEQQCPLLREVCFQTCKEQIFGLREATMRLLQHTRLQPEVDGATTYLAKMDLDKIIPSPSLKSQDSYSDDWDVLGAPTTRPLAVLKVMYDLYVELKSEFLRRLMLCLCPDAIQASEKLDAGSLHRWHTILSNITGTSQKMLTKLDHSYEWHKERPTSRRRDGGQYKPLQVKWSPGKHLVTAVHSLRLHLDFALNGAITSEEHITSLSEDVISNQDQMEKTCKILETLLEGANEKLQSSHSCLQQASMALAKLQGKQLKKQTTGDVKTEQQVEADPDAELPMATLVMPVAPEDMDFEDVVYEADMADEDHCAADQDLDSDWLLEEKARRRQEAEETKHLLQELHTVLGQRSKERERRQLSRTGQAGESQSSPAETPNTEGVDERTKESLENIENKQASPDEAEITSKNSDSSIDDRLCNEDLDESRTSESDSRTSKNGDEKSVSEDPEKPIPRPSHRPFGLPPPRMGLPFMTSVAVEAVMKSKLRGALTEETFGQDEDSVSDEEDED
ncbi:vezatin-like [Amphiura filiformis]|uniref:vezatin-like n=1 Tax=Amphiura filiformis TaxID=82378 RepID=UPI003B21A18E